MAFQRGQERFRQVIDLPIDAEYRAMVWIPSLVVINLSLGSGPS